MLLPVSKSLALFTSTKVVPNLSDSYPFTYALNGETPIANLVALPLSTDV